MHRTWMLYIPALAFILGGCGSVQTANGIAQSTWVGKTSDEFFIKHGPPKRDHTLASGGKVYNWESTIMGARQQLECSADIVVDPRGRITEIRMQKDTLGLWNISRCTEVFGG